jgi:menaquinone-dependent protoporphyrinogen oxidase
VKDISSITQYDGIIIGSAIRMFKLLPETLKFAKRFRDSLRDKPTAYFVVCLTMREDNEKNRTQVEGYFKPLYEIKEPVSIGLFAGKMDYSKLSFIWRKLFSRIKIEEGDFRNWDLITDWAKRVGEIMMDSMVF